MRSEKNQRYAPRLVDKTEVEIVNWQVRDSAATERRPPRQFRNLGAGGQARGRERFAKSTACTSLKGRQLMTSERVNQPLRAAWIPNHRS